MKIRRTDHAFLPMRNGSHRPWRNHRKKKTKSHKFRRVLRRLIEEQANEEEEFRILLPRHGHFWDNGYEDLE